ncbi:MAG TPA: hypothetical protein VIG30_19720, partial [Ktedonobacterales bacterium]
MSQPSSTPTDPVCAALAPLLPLVAHDLLASVMGAEQAAEARAHLATCAHCQHELDLHARVDGALRQAFAVRADAAPPLAHEQLAALIASDAPAAVERPSPARVRMPRRPRRAVLAGLPAAAAVLLIALFAGYLFRSGGHGDPARPTPTVAPAFNLPAGTRLTSIAPVSSDEWWAAGALWRAAGAGTPTRNQDTPGTVAPVIVHALAGHLSLAALPPLPFQGAYGVALTGIAMDSPTDGWAIGNTVLPPNADGWTLSVLLHYTGGAWIQVHAPMSGRLDAIAMRTANDGWMAGQDNSGQTQVFHYDGASWTQVHDPALAHLILHSIA